MRAEALAQVARATGAAPVLMHQVHGADVRVVDRQEGRAPTADAILTGRSGVALLARAADCVPVLLADPATAGSPRCTPAGPGSPPGSSPAAVDALRELGADPTVAWIGPHVCGACYEVPAELRDEVSAARPRGPVDDLVGHPCARPRRRRARPARGRRDHRRPGGRQLHPRGPDLASYRRDGAAATRFAGVVWSHP